MSRVAACACRFQRPEHSASFPWELGDHCRRPAQFSHYLAHIDSIAKDLERGPTCSFDDKGGRKIAITLTMAAAPVSAAAPKAPGAILGKELADTSRCTQGEITKRGRQRRGDDRMPRRRREKPGGMEPILVGRDHLSEKRERFAPHSVTCSSAQYAEDSGTPRGAPRPTMDGAARQNNTEL